MLTAWLAQGKTRQAIIVRVLEGSSSSQRVWWGWWDVSLWLVIGPPSASTSFFFKVLFFPLAHGVRSGAPKLQISLAPLEKKSCRGDEMEKGLCQASWTRWRVNCLQMESCSTSEVGGEEGLGAFKGRIEPGTRKLRGDGRDKEENGKMDKGKKEKPGRASKRERTDRRWRARFEGSAVDGCTASACDSVGC